MGILHLLVVISLLFTSSHRTLPAAGMQDPPAKAKAAPPCLTDDAVEVKDNLYNFKYDSWIRENEDKTRFMFGRCIKTDPSKKLWVDWKETGVRGWTRERDGEIRSGIESQRNDHEVIQTELWYGAGPKKTNSSYRDPKDAQAVTSGGTLRSYVKMGLARAPMSEQDEKTAKPIDVYLEFESSVLRTAGGGCLYTVTWSNKWADPKVGRPTFFVKWPEDSSVEKMLIGTVDKGMIEKHLLLEFTVKGAHFLDQEKSRQPTSRKVVVTFLDENRHEVGAAPVMIYEPKK